MTQELDSPNSTKPNAHNNKKSFPIVDLVKLLGAILVLVLHCQQYSDFYGWINATDSNLFVHFFGVGLFDGLCRMAVPFFFIATSFFLFRKIRDAGSKEAQNNVIKKYIIHLLIVYLAWFLINILWVAYKKFYALRNDYNVGEMLLFLVRDIFFQNGFGASWFIMASIIDSFLVFAFTRRKVLREIGLVISIAFYICCLFSSWYNFLTPSIFVPLFSFITTHVGRMSISFPVGLIFFYIGYYFANYEEKISKISIKYLLIFIIISFLLYFSEIYFVPMIPSYTRVSATAYVSSLVLIPLLFLLAINSNIRISERINSISSLLRKCSSLMYLSHATIVLIIEIVISHCFSSLNNAYIFLIVLPIVLLLDSLFIFIYIKLSNLKCFKFLKRII